MDEDGFDDDSCCLGEDGRDEGRCDECLMFGEYQCSAHSGGYLLACAEEDDRREILGALEVIARLGPRFGGVAEAMSKMATEAAREIGGA